MSVTSEENEKLRGIFYRLTYTGVFDSAANISLFGHILKFSLRGELTLVKSTGCSQRTWVQFPVPSWQLTTLYLQFQGGRPPSQQST